MKKQNKAIDRDLSETDISSIPDGEYKAIIKKILTGLKKRLKDINETFTTKIKELKKNQSEMKNVINEIGNNLMQLTAG